MKHPLLSGNFPQSVFLTGTGTNVGKTVAAALLCKLWEAEYWKPVQAGTVQQDSWEVLRLCGAGTIHMSSVQLEEPASPHLAARREGVQITVAELVNEKPQAFYLVTEGAGGALVPLSETEDMTDLALALGDPVMIVASTQLGTLHHTLSTIAVLRQRGARIAGVLLSGPAHGENARVIAQRGQVPILGRIPPMYPLDAQALEALAKSWLHSKFVDPCQEETPLATAVQKSVLEADKTHIWHPYTQHALAAVPLEIVSAHGAVLHTADGGEVVDAVSSWWVCNHGHAHPHIAQAVAAQASTLEQVIFAGCTHAPAVTLVERLLPVLPGAQSRAFFSDNGSTAVEVALKAILQSARQRGVQKPRVAALQGAYHGDTFGAMAVGERSIFSAPFDPFLFEVDRLHSPACQHDPLDPASKPAEQRALDSLAQWLEEAGTQAAAVIVEPSVQGSAGMLMYSRRYLEGLDALCHKHGVPWIADEVFTGFGRTGQMFACSDLAGQPQLRPSAICLSKGLTGGFLPMGLTTFREEIFADFFQPDRSRTFFHGHSFTANPLGCAAAIASLELCLQEETRQKWRDLEQWHRAALSELSAVGATGCRVLGTIAAFELPGAPTGYLAPRGQQIAAFAREHGVLVRPLGETLYVVPPYCLRQKQHQHIFDVLMEAIESLSN